MSQGGGNSPAAQRIWNRFVAPGFVQFFIDLGTSPEVANKLVGPRDIPGEKPVSRTSTTATRKTRSRRSSSGISGRLTSPRTTKRRTLLGE